MVVAEASVLEEVAGSDSKSNKGVNGRMAKKQTDPKGQDARGAAADAKRKKGSKAGNTSFLDDNPLLKNKIGRAHV